MGAPVLRAIGSITGGLSLLGSVMIIAVFAPKMRQLYLGPSKTTSHQQVCSPSMAGVVAWCSVQPWWLCLGFMRSCPCSPFAMCDCRKSKHFVEVCWRPVPHNHCFFGAALSSYLLVLVVLLCGDTRVPVHAAVACD